MVCLLFLFLLSKETWYGLEGASWYSKSAIRVAQRLVLVWAEAVSHARICLLKMQRWKYTSALIGIDFCRGHVCTHWYFLLLRNVDPRPQPANQKWWRLRHAPASKLPCGYGIVWIAFLSCIGHAGASCLTGRFTHLLSRHLIIPQVPGSAFGDDKTIRICYATSEKLLSTAMQKFRSCLEELLEDWTKSAGLSKRNIFSSDWGWAACSWMDQTHPCSDLPALCHLDCYFYSAVLALRSHFFFFQNFNQECLYDLI